MGFAALNPCYARSAQKTYSGSVVPETLEALSGIQSTSPHMLRYVVMRVDPEQPCELPDDIMRVALQEQYIDVVAGRICSRP